VLSRPQPKVHEREAQLLDLRDIKGQESAKRALEIAAAGGHHLLMIGSPGAGKSMLAARLPSILPPLSPSEPCRCGHAYEPGYSCKRGRIDRCTSDYQARISGPLMDRIDLRIEVPAVTAADLILPPPAEGSAEVAARVAAARDIQLKRYMAAGLPQVRTNAEAPASVLETIAQPDAQGLKLLRDAAETMRLSARGYHRVLRVARTLADLDGAEKIGRLHLAEALSYRVLAEDLRRAA
jgi:magnesium chelatase family protein